MKVRVRLFASAREAVGQGEVEAELGEGATVAQLLETLGATYPRLAPLAPSLLVAVNREYRGRDVSLREGDEVGIIPPVSGGVEESAKGVVCPEGREEHRPRMTRMGKDGVGRV